MDRDRAKEIVRDRISCRDYLRKAKKGGYICPYCDSGNKQNQTGAVHFYEDSNTWYCFSCQQGGDIFDLLEKEQGLDFKGALEYAAEKLNIPLDDLRPRATAGAAAGDQSAGKPASPATGDRPAKAKPEQLPDFSEYYALCRERLADPVALAYLTARGISREAAETCGIGFDPEADPAGKGKSPRLIIPITESFYTARRMDDSSKEKYLNPGGSKSGIFDPYGLLYPGKGVLFVTEGALDAVSIIEAGGDAIGLNGTGNSDKLLEMLEERPTKATLLLCIDNDEPGQKAAQKLADGLKRLNISFQDCCGEICGECKDPNEALLACGRESFLQRVRAAETQAKKPANTANYIDTAMRREIERFREGRGRKTGFPNLDKQAGGLYSGLYVIAAISSLGKTSFALQLADQIAAAGTDVIFFSLEQSCLELVSKSIARYTCNSDPAHAATALQIREGVTDDTILDAIADYKDQIQDRLSIVEGNFSCDVSFIRDYTRSYMQRTGTKPVVIIDYLQILQGDPKQKQSTKELIDSTVTELKRTSRELDITVFVISSLNRMNYLTPVSFESLKESGSIEYSADVIYGLQLRCINEELFGKEGKLKEKRDRIREAKAAEPREIELLCLKNRYGISSFSCYFDYYPANDLFRPAAEFETESRRKY